MMLRAIFYLSLVVVFVAGVAYKINVIKEKRSAPTLSILKEWQSDGKPVEIHAAERGNITLMERTSAEVESPQRAVARVSRVLHPKFKRNGEVFIHAKEQSLAGRIEWVASYPDPLTGLYDVRIRPHQPFDKERVGQSVVLDVVISQVSNVLRIPARALVPTKDGDVVWKLGDEGVKRVPVKIGRSSSEYVEILAGVEPGDEVIVRGQSLLEEGETVRVISSNSVSRGVE